MRLSWVILFSSLEHYWNIFNFVNGVSVDSNNLVEIKQAWFAFISVQLLEFNSFWLYCQPLWHKKNVRGDCFLHSSERKWVKDVAIFISCLRVGPFNPRLELNFAINHEVTFFKLKLILESRSVKFECWSFGVYFCSVLHRKNIMDKFEW
mgnify:CR=1 FL=1